jgi:hypothetical protein
MRLSLREIGVGALLVVALAVLLWSMDVSLKARCGEVMALARSPRDSLDAKIACEKMVSDANTAIAIGAASGAAAGAMAGSRR